MIGDGTPDTTFGRLAFKNTPDFENPADADMDNVYMVTVKVTDNGVDNKNKMSATRDVMITVTNVKRRRRGNLLLSPAQGRTALHRHPQRPRRHDHRRQVGVEENI